MSVKLCRQVPSISSLDEPDAEPYPDRRTQSFHVRFVDFANACQRRTEDGGVIFVDPFSDHRRRSVLEPLVARDVQARFVVADPDTKRFGAVDWSMCNARLVPGSREI